MPVQTYVRLSQFFNYNQPFINVVVSVFTVLLLLLLEPELLLRCECAISVPAFNGCNVVRCFGMLKQSVLIESNICLRYKIAHTMYAVVHPFDAIRSLFFFLQLSPQSELVWFSVCVHVWRRKYIACMSVAYMVTLPHLCRANAVSILPRHKN